MNNKLPALMEHLTDTNPDIIFLTETWLTSEKNNITAEVKDYGYNLLHKIRKNREKDRGGGVGTMVKISRTAKQLISKDYHSFEHNVVRVQLENKKFLFLITVYRLQFVPVMEFINEFEELLEKYAVLNDDVVITGDVNIHMETEDSPARKFGKLLDRYDLIQHVIGPSHIMGHTIDIVISPNRPSYIKDLVVRKVDLSHHFLIEFSISARALSSETKTITYRPWKKMDHARFSQDINDTLKSYPETQNLAEKITIYDKVLKEKADQYSPLITKVIKVKSTAPWFDSEYQTLRRKRRKAEKKYKKSRSAEDKDEYIKLRKDTTELAKDKKTNAIKKKIEEGSSKALYQVVNKLTDNEKSNVLPTARSDEELANNFLKYFQEKIEKIRAKFPPQEVKRKGRTKPGVKQLSTFSPTTAEELRKIISEHGVKSSPEDPLPAEVLKQNLDTFLPFWVEIVNLSLETACMDKVKSSVVLPLIKELNSMTDTENYKNYRPVSNLVFIGKLIERVVDIRLQDHLDANNLNIKEEYGYKQSHSTEMLLTYVSNTLLEACDKKIPSVVLLLDLSAAFDTVDHDKLLLIMEEEIGITGVALEWFRAFLTNRTQKVKIGDSYSDVALLLFGVIQGSILGPRLFNIYIRSVYKRVQPTQFEIVGFADDHQLIKQFLIQLRVKTLGDDIRNCLEEIAEWMREHFLCLNQSKTKILVVAPPSVKEKIKINGVILDEGCIRFVESAKNLGVVIDSMLTFEEQIEKLVKSCFLTIRRLSKVRIYLTQHQLQVLVSSLVFSKLDYCNSLYYGLPTYTIKKLQHVQNCCARLVWKQSIPARSSLNGIFLALHWLQVRFRIIYKILLITHNCLHKRAPVDVQSMLSYSTFQRNSKLRETRALSSYGDRAFSHVAPKLWNLLPNEISEEEDIVEFKKKVKSFLLTRGDEFIQWTRMR